MDYNIHMTKKHGFTLIELIVTMAVVSILLVTGIPALNQMTDSNRLVSQVNSIAGSLSLARSEAIKSASVVTVCASSTGAACTITPWGNGWIVFTDVDKDTAIDAEDNLLKVQEAFGGGSTLRLTLSTSANVYQFAPDGSSRGTSKGTFIVCPKDKTVNKAKAININLIGRASRAQGATETSKPVFDADGDAVTCP